MTEQSHSDRSDILLVPVEELEPGMAVEGSVPDVFWEIVSVEEKGYYIDVELVHGRRIVFDSGDTAVIQR